MDGSLVTTIVEYIAFAPAPNCALKCPSIVRLLLLPNANNLVLVGEKQILPPVLHNLEIVPHSSSLLSLQCQPPITGEIHLHLYRAGAHLGFLQDMGRFSEARAQFLSFSNKQ